MSAQMESRLLSLDEASKCQVLAHLELPDLAAVAMTCSQLRNLVIQAAHPLYTDLLRKEYPGLEFQGGHAALPLFRALRSKLSETALSKHTTDTHVRYQAVYTDGGVDENLYSQFWCDKAFQCNGWGAFCSKISPHVHVLGMLKAHTRREQLVIQLRLVCAELCKWAAGRLLARVPLPALGTRLTTRQQRFFSKSGASLLRWHHRGLFRMFCVLYKARILREVLGQTLELGVALGECAPGTHMHKALQAMLGANHPLCTADVVLPPLASPGHNSHQLFHHEHLPTGQQTQQLSTKVAKAIKSRAAAKAATISQAIGESSAAAAAAAAGSSSAGNKISLTEYTQLLLDTLYALVLPYTELPVATASVDPASINAMAPLLPAPPAPAAPLPAELVRDMGDPSALLTHTAAEIPALAADFRPPLHVEADATGLHALDTDVAGRFQNTHELANVASVLDMVSVSRAGNFTCPIRTGAVFCATMTGACLSPEAWLAHCVDRGQALPPYRQLPPSVAVAIPSRTAAAAGNEPMLARDLLARLTEAKQFASSSTSGRAVANGTMTAAQKTLHEVEVEVMRAYCHAITSQTSVTQLNNMTSADQVFAAVKAGKLPQVAQYRLLLNAEVIEFEPQATSNDAAAHGLGAVAGCDAAAGSHAGAPMACPAVAMQPLLWFRFFTKSEVQALHQVYKFHTQGNPSSTMPATSRACVTEPWGILPDASLKKYTTKFTRKWQQQQDRANGLGSKKSRRKSKKQQLAEQKRWEQPRVPPTPEQLQSVVPQELMVMNPAGQIEHLDVTGCLTSPVTLEQYAWGAELLACQQAHMQPQNARQTRSRSRSHDGPQHAGSSSEWDSNLSDILHESDDSDMMDTESSELDAQLDFMHEDIGPLNIEPAVDVQQLLDMMGYEAMEVDGNDGAGDAAANGGEGAAPANGPDDEGHSSDLDASGSGSYQDNTSDYSSDVEDSDLPSGAETDDEMSGDSDSLGMNLMMGYGSTSDDDFSDSDDMGLDVADFPDLVDDTPPTTQEHSLVVLLSGLVGLEPLTQSHLELEKEASSIIDEVLFEKEKAKHAAAAAFSEAFLGEGSAQPVMAQPVQLGSGAYGEVTGSMGGTMGQPGKSAKPRGKGKKGAAAAVSGAEKVQPAANGGKKGGKKKTGGVVKASRLDAAQLAERGPLLPYPHVPVEFLPGDETALDSVAFKPLISSHDMRNQPGMLQVRLRQARAANMVLLKLITPEDLMTEMDDPHSDPNVDIQFVAFRGRAFKLPQGTIPAVPTSNNRFMMMS